MPEGCLCDQCAALCCRYFALPIDNPETAKDYDNIRWYLIHENVIIFVEDDQWYIGVLNRCKYLQSDNRCGIYATRPKICRGYSTDSCEFHGGDYGYQHLFVSAEQLERHAKEALAEAREARRLKAARKRRRSRKKDMAAILRTGAAAAVAKGRRGGGGGAAAVPLTIRGRRAGT